MRDEILKLLEKEKNALSLIDIADKFNLNTIEGIKKITDTLIELEEECLIYHSNKDKYILFNDSHLLKGKYSLISNKTFNHKGDPKFLQIH